MIEKIIYHHLQQETLDIIKFSELLMNKKNNKN